MKIEGRLLRSRLTTNCFFFDVGVEGVDLLYIAVRKKFSVLYRSTKLCIEVLNSAIEVLNSVIEVLNSVIEVLNRSTKNGIHHIHGIHLVP